MRIFADAHVKHGAHAIVQDRPIAELVRNVEFFNADVVIATGQRTGDAADLAYIREIKSAASLPVLVGSGVTADNVCQMLGIVEGAIVASALEVGGRWWNPVDCGARKAVCCSRPGLKSFSRAPGVRRCRLQPVRRRGTKITSSPGSE